MYTQEYTQDELRCRFTVGTVAVTRRSVGIMRLAGPGCGDEQRLSHFRSKMSS